MPARNLKLCLGGSVLAAIPLLLAGCGQDADNTATSNQATASATPEADTGAADTTYVVDETASPDAAQVVAVPAPVAAADASEAAPLDDAETIVRQISDGHGIERIRHGDDGWAWMRDGHIIRTASADGKQVAYFRNGSDNPFLVQNGDHAYAYSGNGVAHAYDHGRPQKIGSNDRDTAGKLAGKARDDRKDAQHVAETHHRPAPRPTPTPTPSPTHEPSHGKPDHSSRNDQQHGRDDTHGRGSTHPTPTPSPTPSPSPSHTHRTGHDRGSPGD